MMKKSKFFLLSLALLLIILPIAEIKAATDLDEVYCMIIDNTGSIKGESVRVFEDDILRVIDILFDELLALDWQTDLDPNVKLEDELYFIHLFEKKPEDLPNNAKFFPRSIHIRICTTKIDVNGMNYPLNDETLGEFEECFNEWVNSTPFQLLE